jgi:hypothetical protein
MAAALHRHERFDPFDAIGLAACGMNLGVNDPGANGVDANTFRRHFFCQTEVKVSMAAFAA